MTDLLIKLFVKDNKNTSSPEVRSAYAMLAGAVGIILNVLLFAVKLTVGILSFSVSIIADAFNNISDAGSSLISMIGFRLSAKPVDKEHPLGHGRLEYISAFIVDMLIILVAFELLTSSIEKIVNPVATEITPTVFIFLGAAVIVKLWLAIFYSSIGKKISAASVKASAADSITDCVATLVVLIGSAFSYFGILDNVPLDGILGILVAAFIGYTGIKAAKDTIDLLLGSKPDPELLCELESYYLRYPEIVGIHDLMVHDYGPGRKIVSFHAEVPAESDIIRAHEVIDQMERDMFAHFNCIVTVHLDPIFTNDERVTELREFTAALAREIDPSLLIHDFRITDGEKYTNMIFDLVVPTDSQLSLNEAESRLHNLIKEKNAMLFPVIKAEHPFV